MKRLVLIGGGHGHLEVLRQLPAHPTGADITLVDPARFAAYSGMLPGLIAGHYDFHDCHIDLAGLAQQAGARYVQTHARTLDTAGRAVVLSDGARLDYDLVSVNVGSVPPTAVAPRAGEHVIAAKPVAEFLHGWAALIERARSGTLKNLVVIGGGAAGVELVLAMQYRLARPAPLQPIRFALVTDTDRILPGCNAAARGLLQALLSQRGIEIHLNARVTRLEPGAAMLSNAGRIAADAIVLATGAGAPAWLAGTNLALDGGGFVAIDEHLRSTSHREVFAAGDCASMLSHPHPKSGVYAVRQGPVLAHNLRCALAGKPLSKYRPQRRALALISGGDKRAAASYGDFALAGAWVWRWKNRIDRRFVARYHVDG